MTIDDYKALPFDELRSLHRELGTLIAERRHEALQQLRDQAAMLGFSAEDLAPPKLKRGKAAPRFRDPADPHNIWTGRGKPPQWMQDLLDRGHDRNEFAIKENGLS